MSDNHVNLLNEENDGLIHPEFTAVEFYTYLLTEHGNDSSKIGEFLAKLGFIQSCPLQLKDFNDQPQAVQYSHCVHLAEYSCQLPETSSHSAEDFMASPRLRRAYEGSVLLLKYMERWGARYWQNKWAREMRGLILFVHPSTHQVRVLCYKLPRGAEVMTGLHKSSGIDETQDVKQGKLNIFDAETVDTCTRLAQHDEAIDLYLTSKADGSLLLLSVYTGQAKGIMLAAVEAFGKLCLVSSLKLTFLTHNILFVLSDSLLSKSLQALCSDSSMIECVNICRYIAVILLASTCDIYNIHIYI